MVKKASRPARAKAAPATRRKKRPDLTAEEEQICREATIHLIRKHGFFVASGIREERHEGCRRWILPVTLRYPTGHEGYIGDLLYDGKEFTFLTPPEVMRERERQIATDPERMRKWYEYRSSTLQAGKR